MMLAMAVFLVLKSKALPVRRRFFYLNFFLPTLSWYYF